MVTKQEKVVSQYGERDFHYEFKEGDEAVKKAAALLDQKKPDKAPRKVYEPVTLEELKATVTDWLAIADQDVLEIVLAFSIGEQLPGDPLWLFLIAPPGGAKTEILRAIKGERFEHLSDLTNASFVSGLTLGQGEHRKKIDDLLPQLDGKTLLFKDFTTVLEKGREMRQEIFAQLREIYDGQFSKKFGSLDHKVSYEVRFGLIAGVTPVIDRHWKVMQQLGERFLKYRWHEDADTVTRQAERIEGREKQMRDEIQRAIMGFLTNLEVSEPSFPDHLVEPLIESAKYLAILRTPVTIHAGKSDFYYDFIPVPERPTRLVKQLKKVCKALAVVRGRDTVTAEDVVTAQKLAISTAPQDRIAVLDAVKALQHRTIDGCTATSLKDMVRLPETSIRNILQQLVILDLVDERKVIENKSGWQQGITFYRLSGKVPAPTPPQSLEGSKNVRGVGARGTE